MTKVKCRHRYARQFVSDEQRNIWNKIIRRYNSYSFSHAIIWSKAMMYPSRIASNVLHTCQISDNFPFWNDCNQCPCWANLCFKNWLAQPLKGRESIECQMQPVCLRMREIIFHLLFIIKVETVYDICVVDILPEKTVRTISPRAITVIHMAKNNIYNYYR